MLKSVLIAAGIALVLAGCSKSAPSGGTQGLRIAIAVTDSGFVPATVTVPVGRPVTLVVTRRTEATCATDIVFEGQGIRKDLPLNEKVEVTFTPKSKGSVQYSCGMGMVTGTLVVE